MNLAIHLLISLLALDCHFGVRFCALRLGLLKLMPESVEVTMFVHLNDLQLILDFMASS